MTALVALCSTRECSLSEPVHYATMFCFNEALSKMVGIVKARPEWMKGMMNAPGGHVEPGEEPLAAALREFKEETGVDLDIDFDNTNVTHFAKLYYPEAILDCFCATHPDIGHSIETTTDEVVSMVDVYLFQNIGFKTIPNMRWLVPMAIRAVRKEGPDRFMDILVTA